MKESLSLKAKQKGNRQNKYAKTSAEIIYFVCQISQI